MLCWKSFYTVQTQDNNYARRQTYRISLEKNHQYRRIKMIANLNQCIPLLSVD